MCLRNQTQNKTNIVFCHFNINLHTGALKLTHFHVTLTLIFIFNYTCLSFFIKKKLVYVITNHNSINPYSSDKLLSFDEVIDVFKGLNPQTVFFIYL